MDLTFLSKYAIPVIVGICLCLGFIIKYAIKTEKVNRFIPLIMGVLGLGIVIADVADISDHAGGGRCQLVLADRQNAA